MDLFLLLLLQILVDLLTLLRLHQVLVPVLMIIRMARYLVLAMANANLLTCKLVTKITNFIHVLREKFVHL